MRNCAIYSSQFDLEQLYEIIQSIYPDASIQRREDRTHIQVTRKKWFSKKTKGFNIMTSQTHPEEFSTMIQGMLGFLSQIEGCNAALQEKVLIKCSTLNMVIGIETEEDISEEFFNELLQLAEALDAVIFWGGGSLLNAQGQLLLDVNGESEVEDYTVTAHTSYLDDTRPPSADAVERKARSEQRLTEEGIPYNVNLPTRAGENDTTIRTKEEVAQRAVALCLAALKGECLGAGESADDTAALVQEVIDKYDASTFFSSDEKSFLDQHGADQQDVIRFSWGYEAYHVMLWALGYVDKLGAPTELCNVSQDVGYLQQKDSFGQFLSDATLRSKSELLDEADLIYRYNWVCVNSRIKGEAAPAGLNPGVAFERHRALNWLICYLDQAWDEVRTDT
ncbi:DUF4272 domain-containing protein [Paenibacillus barcinonensis]|uniref:DUF4272 domain-containing protein n=1 Tax=Paenibacillus TaxID=44249 RepID=UPI001C0F3C81|nr:MULTISPECIES: DUF4272 domain-containing protein [Paenibacillus]MBU5356233.1 DUF4272 domain-containing protein [Paenibacillus barcinonensis]MDM5279024.1 DUF4272 domain-containing protein [Paenibacillus silvae]